MDTSVCLWDQVLLVVFWLSLLSPRLHASTLKTLHALHRKRKCHTIIFLKQEVSAFSPLNIVWAVLAKLSVVSVVMDPVLISHSWQMVTFVSKMLHWDRIAVGFSTLALSSCTHSCRQAERACNVALVYTVHWNGSFRQNQCILMLFLWEFGSFASMRGGAFVLLLGQPRPLCGVVWCAPCSGHLTEEVRGGWGLSSESWPSAWQSSLDQSSDSPSYICYFLRSLPWVSTLSQQKLARTSFDFSFFFFFCFQFFMLNKNLHIYFSLHWISAPVGRSVGLISLWLDQCSHNSKWIPNHKLIMKAICSC